MKQRFNPPHIILALLATLVLAGLFYVPYLWVRNKTVDAFHAQQTLLARQSIGGIQSFFTTYEKALDYLTRQPSIQTLDKTGEALLRDFLSIHAKDIDSIQRIDAEDRVLFSIPNSSAADRSDDGFCLGLRNSALPRVSDLVHIPTGEDRLFFAAPVAREGRFDGCVSFSLPFLRIAGRHIDALPLLHDGTVLLFNGAGDILHAPRSGLVGANLGRIADLEGDVAAFARMVRQSQQGIQLLQGDPFSRDAPVKSRVYAVTIPISLPGGTTWSIVIFTPAKAVLGAMAEFRSLWSLVTGIAMLAVGLLSFFVSGLAARRREEQRLRALEEQLAGLLDLAPMGVLLIQADGGIVYANQEAQVMAGVHHQDQLVGRSFATLFHPDSQRSVKEIVRQSSSGDTVAAGNARGGEPTPREYVVTAAPYRQGGEGQSIVIVRDVTAERKSEEDQRRLAAAVDQVKEAVLILHRFGTIEYGNAALEEMTGYGREELLGQSVRMLWEKEQEAHFDQHIRDVARLGEVWRGRIVNRRKDGSLFVAAATVSPVRDGEDAVTHVAVVQRDITHEVEMESRMRQAQKMEAIGTLAGGIAHDFNNILGGIIGFTDMALLQCDPSSDLYSHLKHIRKGGKRAADLVQQILTFSRQSSAEKEPVLVAPLVVESLKLMRATLPATIEIRQELLAGDARVLAVPVQIQQIVMNLCANAFDAMREQGGRLTVRLEELSAEACGKEQEGKARRWVSLLVRDTGEGIDDEFLQRIFNPFFTTKETGKGTGMGLSVVHGIVTDLGGEITVRSHRGEGAAFTVLLPVTEESADGALKSSEDALPRGAEHVLVVDDEKEIRDICRMMLAHLGYTVTTCGRAEEVLALLADQTIRIDLVVTDQTMPRVTGVDLTRAIRREYPHIPVILCTGFSDRLNYDIAREAGACDLLMKPVDLRGLGTAVRAALDMRERDRPAAGSVADRDRPDSAA
jgi:PAS domain S-box-containing protein